MKTGNGSLLVIAPYMSGVVGISYISFIGLNTDSLEATKVISGSDSM